ncbi:CBS domain-containing protein [Nonomuraea maheshkhaliensis]|uniref:CBS domain-containing protein n=1 Tax=Nonomuraea maheshkhaliensis TaxID=419590 RepID=A0ABP4U7M6_9ACTN
MRITVKDVMTTDVASVEAGAMFKDVAEVLVERGVSAVPVLDGERRVLGVVSEGDLMRKEEFREQYYGESYRPPLRARLRRRMTGEADGSGKAGGRTAAELMTAPAVTVAPSASIARAARIMDECGVRRLVVVDADDRLRGIVSRRDLLRMYLRDDDETRRRVVEGISPHARWNDRDGILVEVHDGIVTLSGHTRKRSDADAAVRSTRRMEGIVDVEEALTWKENDVIEVPVTWRLP